MNKKLEIQTLGGLNIRLDETAVSNFASRKVTALLAYLACNPRSHSREFLATLLWPNNNQTRALANLSVALSSLKKQAGAYLLVERHRIGFNTEAEFWLDTAVFQQAITQARQVQKQQGKLGRASAAQLATAVSLYKGDFLTGFTVRGAPEFEAWAMLEQERLHLMQLTALADLITFHQQRQQWDKSIYYGQQLLAGDSLRESTHRQLMTLYMQNNQRTAALAQYKQCVHILDNELGVKPDEETTALYKQIVSSNWENSPLLLRSPALPLPHNLPTPITSFVGREQELAHIDERLNSPICRLLTITGPGGVGKTRLLMAAARRQLSQYLDGVWFVRLASLPSADYLETAVADALGFSFSGNDSPQTQIINFLRQKELLLLLDNFEHLLSENGISLITAILTHAPECQLLISSRERLNLQAEWLLEIDGLPCPTHSHPASEHYNLETCAAIELFQQRAQQMVPHFQLNEDTLPLAAEISSLLAGMPLGIELAAANLRYFKMTDIVAGIQESIDFLQTHQRDIPQRHRSLRAVIDHSWQTLRAAEQRAFMALSLFQGRFSVQAALAVLKTNPTMLHALVDKSLLQRSENGRLQMHNILRQYAAERLADLPDQAIQAQGRHGTFYANLLQQWHLPIKGGQQIEALVAIQADIENIRMGWQYAQTFDRQTPNLIPLLGNALDALFHFYSIRSSFREGAAIFKQAIAWLSSPTNEKEQVLQARIRAKYGWFAFLLGKRDGGEAALRQSLATLQTTSHFADVVFSLNHLGAIGYYRHNFEQAQADLSAAMSLAQTAGDVHGEAIGLNIMGVLHIDLGELEQAQKYLHASLTLKRQIGDQWGVAFSLEKLGNVEMAFYHFGKAERRFQESLSIRRQLKDQRGVALCLQQLGDLAMQRKDTKTAVSHYTECLTLFEKIGDAQATAAVREKLI